MTAGKIYKSVSKAPKNPSKQVLYNCECGTSVKNCDRNIKSHYLSSSHAQYLKGKKAGMLSNDSLSDSEKKIMALVAKLADLETNHIDEYYGDEGVDLVNEITSTYNDKKSNNDTTVDVDIDVDKLTFNTTDEYSEFFEKYDKEFQRLSSELTKLDDRRGKVLTIMKRVSNKFKAQLYKKEDKNTNKSVSDLQSEVTEQIKLFTSIADILKELQKHN